MKALAAYYRTETVVTVLKRIGYVSRGLPPSLSTMHLCFLGQLHALRPDDVRRVRKAALKKATLKHKRGRWCGHPQPVWADACKHTSEESLAG